VRASDVGYADATLALDALKDLGSAKGWWHGRQ
jgi:hypothetical protein